MARSQSITTARAILLDTKSGPRYFCSFGKSRRVLTAWSLAGAKLFMVDMPVMSHLLGHELEIDAVVAELKSKNKVFKLVTVSAEIV